MNLNELNEEIMLSEKFILEKKFKLIDIKKSLEMLRLNINNSYDSSDKNFSNQQKRDFYINANESVIELTNKVKEIDFITQVLEIELRHKIRTFNIMLKSELI